jgi:ubiquinone/menaquinone biosynthesis C-methylase UbiE
MQKLRVLSVSSAASHGRATMNETIDIYLRVREREGRLYPDPVASQLPATPIDHPLQKEWRARAASSDRLTGYLARLPRAVKVLDLGCGNGWLANRIAETAKANVIGVDLNLTELAQARRLFADRPALSWMAADIFCAPFCGRLFDIVVIASAIQYFADVPLLLQSLIPLLRRGGEIHILDSPFYSAGELHAARERSRRYYEELGLPEMAGHYHHHSTAALEKHNPVWLYHPQEAQIKDSPFPWIRLRPEV